MMKWLGGAKPIQHQRYQDKFTPKMEAAISSKIQNASALSYIIKDSCKSLEN
jgi:hypothetical protein